MSVPKASTSYNTMLTAMGAKHKLGPEKREATAIDAIRA